MLHYLEVALWSCKFLCHKFYDSYVRIAIFLSISELKNSLYCVKKISYSFNLFNVLAVILLQVQ